MKNKIIFILLIASIVVFLAFFTRDLASKRVNIIFKELRPFSGRAEVFYKGYKVGRSLKIKPSKDYSHTIVTILIHPSAPKFPKNIEAQLRKKTIFYKYQHDYIELLEPKDALVELLRSGDTIKGTTTIDVKDFFASQDKESLEKIRQDLADSAENLNSMLSSIGALFTTLDETVAAAKPNLIESSKNLNATSRNFSKMSEKMNQSLDQELLEDTIRNINETSEYIKKSTKNLEETTKSINSLTGDISGQSGQITSAIKGATSTINGINSTLSKPFGGLRLIFGRSVKKPDISCR